VALILDATPLLASDACTSLLRCHSLPPLNGTSQYVQRGSTSRSQPNESQPNDALRNTSRCKSVSSVAWRLRWDTPVSTGNMSSCTRERRAKKVTKRWRACELSVREGKERERERDRER
jgi:hypothetical protein